MNTMNTILIVIFISTAHASSTLRRQEHASDVEAKQALMAKLKQIAKVSTSDNSEQSEELDFSWSKHFPKWSNKVVPRKLKDWTKDNPLLTAEAWEVGLTNAVDTVKDPEFVINGIKQLVIIGVTKVELLKMQAMQDTIDRIERHQKKDPWEAQILLNTGECKPSCNPIKREDMLTELRNDPEFAKGKALHPWNSCGELKNDFVDFIRPCIFFNHKGRNDGYVTRFHGMALEFTPSSTESPLGALRQDRIEEFKLNKLWQKTLHDRPSTPMRRLDSFFTLPRVTLPTVACKPTTSLSRADCYIRSGAQSETGAYGGGKSGTFTGSWSQIPYGCQNYQDDYSPSYSRMIFNQANAGVDFDNEKGQTNQYCSSGWCLGSSSTPVCSN